MKEIISAQPHANALSPTKKNNLYRLLIAFIFPQKQLHIAIEIYKPYNMKSKTSIYRFLYFNTL